MFKMVRHIIKVWFSLSSFTKYCMLNLETIKTVLGHLSFTWKFFSIQQNLEVMVFKGLSYHERVCASDILHEKYRLWTFIDFPESRPMPFRSTLTNPLDYYEWRSVQVSVPVVQPTEVETLRPPNCKCLTHFPLSIKRWYITVIISR